MTATNRRRILWWALAVVIVCAGLAPIAAKQLVHATPEHWQVDLSVYRAAGVSNLQGRAVYDYLAPPQHLPFTYPPFASILAIPLGLVPFKVAGWCWFFVQAAADVAIAGYAVRPLIRRAGEFAPVVLAVAAVCSFYLLPVNDGLRFGQVDAFLLLACLVDVHRMRHLAASLPARSRMPRWLRAVWWGTGWLGPKWLRVLSHGSRWLMRAARSRAWSARPGSKGSGSPSGAGPSSLRWIPPGVLIGVATAIKLTPGMFIVHLLVTRRWRQAAWAISTAIGCTVLAAVVLPGASWAYWAGALEDTGRLGPNDGTSNQSIRGMLLRVGPHGLGGTALWFVLVVVVLVVGLGLARAAYARRDTVAEIALVGLVTVLVSPVSWIHHFDWIVLVIGAILGAGRSRPRIVLAALVFVGFVLDLPWWGQWRLVSTGQAFPADSNGDPWGVLMNNAYGLLALICLALFALHAATTPRREVT